jgi:heterodisulfide reductase subunit D
MDMNIAHYYKDVNLLSRMQLEDPSDYFWRHSKIDPETISGTQTVIYLGCNVLRTLHLAAQFVKIVKALCENVVVLGGPAHCCGYPHSILQGNTTIGRKQGIRAINTFHMLRPKQVILWCPTCIRQFQTEVSIDWENESYEVVHATEFLARNSHLFSYSYPGKDRVVAIHEHADDVHNQEHVRNVRHVLSQLKGISVVDGGLLSGWSYHCNTNAEQPSQTFLDALDGSIVGQADTMVSIYHSCHRALRRAARRRGMECVNYVDLIAEQTGLQVPDRYGYLVDLGDENLIWQEVAGRFKPEEEESVRRLIRNFYGPLKINT